MHNNPFVSNDWTRYESFGVDFDAKENASHVHLGNILDFILFYWSALNRHRVLVLNVFLEFQVRDGAKKTIP